MAFSTKDWKDYPDTSTPIDAAGLEDLEERVTDYTDSELVARVPDPLPDMATSGDDKKVARWDDATDAYIKTEIYNKSETDLLLAAKQASDADLTGLAGLSGNNQRPYRDGSGNWQVEDRTKTNYLPIPIFENPATGTSATTYTASPFSNNVPGYNLLQSGFSIWHSTFVVPADYSSGSMVLRVLVASATGGDIRLSGLARPYADGTSITAALSGFTAQTVTLSANTVKAVDLAASVTPTVGSLMVVRFFRDGDNAADTLAATAYLHAMAFAYTAVI